MTAQNTIAAPHAKVHKQQIHQFNILHPDFPGDAEQLRQSQPEVRKQAYGYVVGIFHKIRAEMGIRDYSLLQQGYGCVENFQMIVSQRSPYTDDGQHLEQDHHSEKNRYCFFFMLFQYRNQAPE